MQNSRGFLSCLALSATLLAMLAVAPPSLQAATCEGLKMTVLPDTKITLAQSVSAGALVLSPARETAPSPRGNSGAASFKDLPAFCRITATLTPTKDSNIHIEVWMPSEHWNGRFLGVGNGGWAGSISYPALADALRRGFATASTDDGTSGISGEDPSSWAMLQSDEKLTDFGYRSTHLMTVEAKSLIQDFYGTPPHFSYWSACSTGGKQGLTEAQRFPDDYNGIVEGDPASFFTHLMFSIQWVVAVARKDPAGPVPQAKFALLHQAVLKACDAQDGVVDGIVSDPMSCHFDPQVLACKGSDGPDCLTAAQVQTVRAIYAGAKNPRTGEQIFPGEPPGSEFGWAGLFHVPGTIAISLAFFQDALFKNPDWKPESLNFDTDVALADRKDGKILNAVDPDLKAFKAHGGKLIMYHGWSDQAIVPLESVNYYNSVVATMGGANKTEDFVRLFMVPGMGHCGKGIGPNTFDKIGPIEQWTEHGIAPDKIIAFRMKDGAADMTRPLCPYPQVARWNGKGSSNNAANFTCVK